MQVQGQEHARTIVALERKLLSSLQNSSNLTTANEGLKAKVTSLETQLGFNNYMHNNYDVGFTSYMYM